MDRVEARAKDLVHALEMVKVRPREIAAGVATAVRVERAGVFAMLRVADLDVAPAREQPAVACVARGHHAVEHVDAFGDCIDDVFRRADAHQVARLLRRKAWRDVRDHSLHVGLRLTDREPADRVAVEADLLQGFVRDVAQVFVHSALNDAEEGVRAIGGRAESIEFVARASRPAQGELHRLRGFIAGRREWRALVEDHHDVGIERALDLHRDLGCQQQLVAVDGRREFDAFLGDLAHGPQAEHLEAAGVGQDRLLPTHESMQSTMSFDDIGTRTQPQVKRVPEDDLRADFVELVGRHRLHRAVGADGHEHRRLHDAMCERKGSASRGAVGVSHFKLHRNWCLTLIVCLARAASHRRS